MIKTTIDDMEKILEKLKCYDILLNEIYEGLETLQMRLNPWDSPRMICEMVKEFTEELKQKIEETEEKI